MKCIVLEGYDGCGKSTLSRYLSKKYSLGIHLIGGRPKDDIQALLMARQQLYISKYSFVIFDRITPISRICYEKSLTNEKVMRHIMYDILHNSILIWCKTDRPRHMNEDYDDMDHLLDIDRRKDKILKRYGDIMSESDHIEYDFTTDDLDELVRQIDGAL